MQKYQEQKFNIQALKGISTKNIEEHLKLYSGYIKNTNMILEKIDELGKDAEKNMYVLGELRRRFSFEWNGMRNHEYYFRSLETIGSGEAKGSITTTPDSSPLKKAIAAEFGSFENWLAAFKTTAMTRGIGWAILYFDPIEKKLLQAWVDEQHLGHLNGGQYIVGIDMWEHSYVYDYQPSGKKQYVEDFLENLNWQVIETNFSQATTGR